MERKKFERNVFNLVKKAVVYMTSRVFVQLTDSSEYATAINKYRSKYLILFSWV